MKLKFNIKIYIILLIIFYIYLTICIYKYFCCNEKKENFIGFLELLSYSTKMDTKTYVTTKMDTKTDTNTDIKTNNKKIKKYIYISKTNNNSTIKYYFYNKNNEIYLITILNYSNKIVIKDTLNNIIGNYINKIYNKITIKVDFYTNNIILEYYNKFHSIKLELEDDDKVFYINKKNNNNYSIKLYTLNIGNIIYDNNNDIYKIIVIEDYKIYLNLFGIGFIMLLHY